LNALIYAKERFKERRDIERLMQLLEANHPEVEAPRLASGITLIDHKLQLALEAIYEGRYLTAISECTDVLDLEPNSVLALTRLGSAYYAMNEQNKAQQVWTKALQLDPNNDVLRKFLYGRKGASRVEKNP
jgi:Tfp pilus assembly protein PilF